MKIFVVEKKQKLKKIIRELEHIYENLLMIQDDCNFKMTKNDFVIINDSDLDENSMKLKNIIVLSDDCSYKNIWNIVCKYNLADIIDSNMEVSYILDRIESKVGK